MVLMKFHWMGYQGYERVTRGVVGCVLVEFHCSESGSGWIGGGQCVGYEKHVIIEFGRCLASRTSETITRQTLRERMHRGKRHSNFSWMIQSNQNA